MKDAKQCRAARLTRRRVDITPLPLPPHCYRQCPSGANCPGPNTGAGQGAPLRLSGRAGHGGSRTRSPAAGGDVRQIEHIIPIFDNNRKDLQAACRAFSDRRPADLLLPHFTDDFTPRRLSLDQHLRKATHARSGARRYCRDMRQDRTVTVSGQPPTLSPCEKSCSDPPEIAGPAR